MTKIIEISENLIKIILKIALLNSENQMTVFLVTTFNKVIIDRQFPFSLYTCIY